MKLPRGKSNIKDYGKLDVQFRLVSGEMIQPQLHDVVLVAQFGRNLFPLNAAADHGQFCKVTNDTTGTCMRDVDLVFLRNEERSCAAVGYGVMPPPQPDASSADATIASSRSPGRTPESVGTD